MAAFLFFSIAVVVFLAGSVLTYVTLRYHRRLDRGESVSDS